MVSDYFMSTYGYAPTDWCRDPNWKDKCCEFCAGTICSSILHKVLKGELLWSLCVHTMSCEHYWVYRNENICVWLGYVWVDTDQESSEVKHNIQCQIKGKPYGQQQCYAVLMKIVPNVYFDNQWVKIEYGISGVINWISKYIENLINTHEATILPQHLEQFPDCLLVLFLG